MLTGGIALPWLTGGLCSDSESIRSFFVYKEACNDAINNAEANYHYAEIQGGKCDLCEAKANSVGKSHDD